MNGKFYRLTGLILIAAALISGGCAGRAQGEAPPASLTPVLGAAQTSQTPVETPAAPVQPVEPSVTMPVNPTSTGDPTAQPSPGSGQPAVTEPTATLQPNFWTELPVVPIVGEGAVRTYQRGLELGNNPHAFSKVGDCGSTPSWFLGDFDRGPQYYSLGEYQELETVIQHFSGSFERTSLAARSGFNASSPFAPLWADPSQCQPGEGPLACEYRVHRPAFALITLGTNDAYHLDEFEPQMRAIIEYSIQQGVVPILATKADNLEGDGSINATISRLALEYDVPLWNYWRAVQTLPDNGLQEDGAHITWGSNHFDDSRAMQTGWAIRNLTALQTLDAVWQAVDQTP